MVVALLLHALNVASVACVDDNLVALFAEERYHDSSASLYSSLCQGVCGSVALSARLHVCYLECCLDRHLSCEDSLCRRVRNDLHDIAFLHVLASDNHVLVYVHLVKCLLVHEHSVLAVHVEELVWTVLYAYILKSLTDVEALLDDIA